MEKFNLKWNDFHSNVSKSFGLFRSEEYLHDVRLMTEDYYEVSAHRLILSACSEYFRNIFKNSKGKDTLICLDGVTDEDLKNVLDYIYLGEAQIYQDQLDRFLAVAEKLKLEGLLRQEQEETNYEEVADTKSQRNILENEEKVSKSTIKTTDRQVPERFSTMIVKTAESAKDYSDLDSKIKEYGERLEDGSRRCTLCEKVVLGRNATNFRNHVERYHMEGLSFDCLDCNKTFRSRNSFHVHKSTFHK